ncbi:hypothetical protein Cop2CBH44_11750 [Coprobacter secundus subsp. similis]|uniref:Uncharacterized protein n=1 Tax=Coprobacter secundus subsp. similis TaxID=2751153 RepID=A0A7G1HVK6_9BACT|nr:hypothetical protein Cop2CBH44_11750 [Coprobacter secundus subsp. similis]
MVELASFVVYVVDGFLVDADEHRVSQFDVFPLDDLIIEVLQQVLVVTDAVAHRLVGALHVQHRAQRLVHHIDDVEGPGVFVQIHIQFLVFAHLFTAVFMQQLIAVLQSAACQQEAALLLVVVDVCFHRYRIESPLRQGCIGEEGNQQESYDDGMSHSPFLPQFSFSLSSPFPLLGSAFSLHRS